MALWSVAFIGVRPIASLVDGAIASVAGTTVATLAMTTPAAMAMVVSMCWRAASGRRPLLLPSG